MAAEYKRQQDSLKYFCEDCLTTEPLLNAEGQSIDMTTGQPWPGGVIGKLTTDVLYTEYMTYCRLLNVPVPAGKSPFGKYISATFGTISVSTTKNGVAIRYYPGLMLAKTARLAFAELSSNYTNYNTTTGELQEGIEEKGLLSLLTTATTGEWPKEVIEEIAKMFCYIESCEDPQDISYSGYVSKLPFPVVAVVKGNRRPDGDKTPVVFPSLPCSSEPETCSFEHTEAEQVKAQDAHFKDVAEKYTGKPDPADLHMGQDRGSDVEKGEKEAAPSPAAPERERFKAGHATTKGKVRIIKQDGYRTQIPSPDSPGKFVDHLYSWGEVVEREPAGAELTPATKARLWDSIGSKLKKEGRKDQDRRGLAASDLSPGELELITEAGWTQETTETGISILWAPEKTLKALAVTA
jgi:hypothetical protein